MTITTTMTVMLATAIILACASLMLNVYQWAERKNERKETNKLIADSALLEKTLDEVKAELDNERLHVSWAKGRIKDQQVTIDKLSAITAPTPTKKNYKTRKEASHD